MSWGRSTREDGLVTAMVGPATVPALAAILDPDAPWVLVTEVGPMFNGLWTRAIVPVHRSEATRPQARTIRSLSFEVLVTTAEFRELAPLWSDQGIRALQLAKAPDDRVDFRAPRVPANRYRAFGLTVGFDLPHAHESAQLVTTSEQVMNEALHRFKPN